MSNENVEILYKWLEDTTEIIQQHKNEPFLESLALSMGILFYKEVPNEFDDLATHKIQTVLKEIDLHTMSTQEIRKATELVILKGMKDSTQPQHLITPETIGLFVGYIANKFIADRDSVRVFDPAIGTANLLTTVLSQLDKSYQAYGSEVDPTLIQLGVNNANLQQKKIEFFHQDSLRPLLLDPVDLVVADLPVGYYPDDIIASEYELKADEGHSYAHHLFIEQSMNYTKEGGYLLFLIPEFLFDSDQSEQLNTYIQQYAHIVGVLKLPDSAFKTKDQVKSIFILQKKGKDTKAPKQPLLAVLPSFKNTIAMEDILVQMNEWFASYKNK